MFNILSALTLLAWQTKIISSSSSNCNSISQSYFLTWHKKRTATSTTTK